MDLAIPTRQQVKIDIKADIVYYLKQRPDTMQEIWRLVAGDYLDGEVTPAAFNIALDQLIRAGRVSYNGSRLALN